MPAECGWPELGRGDRVPVSWDVDGADNTAVVSVLIQGTTLWRTAAFDGQTATVLFAGPDFLTPGAGTVVITETVSCLVRVDQGTTRRTFDGGFVRLLR